MKALFSLKDKVVTVIVMAISLIFGGALGYLGAAAIGEAFDGFDGFGRFAMLVGTVIVAVYVGLFLQIAVHEAGHLVFGVMTGYGFVSYRVGNIILINQGGKLKLAKYSLAGTSGQCLMSPPAGSMTDYPVFLYNMGGCIMNLIFSALTGLLWVFCRDVPILPAFAGIVAMIGLFFAVLNGIPVKVGPVSNDGTNALTLMKNPLAREAFWKQLRINQLNSSGTRLRDMPEELFRMSTDGDDALSLSVHVFAMSRAVDSLDFTRAADIGNKLLEKGVNLPDIYKALVTAEVTYCELVGGGDRDKIAKLYTKQTAKMMKTTAKSLPSSARFMYAYELLYNGDEKAASKALDMFEKIAKRYPHQHEIDGERELIDIARRRAEETPESGPS